VDQCFRRTEQMNSKSWMEGYLSEKLKIATLGRRRARSGKSRYLEETSKFLESCRSSGAPGSGSVRSRSLLVKGRQRLGFALPEEHDHDQLKVIDGGSGNVTEEGVLDFAYQGQDQETADMKCERVAGEEKIFKECAGRRDDAVEFATQQERNILQPEELSELMRMEASEIEPDQYQSRLYCNDLDGQYVLEKGSDVDAVRAPGARGEDHRGARGDRANCQESSTRSSRRPVQKEKLSAKEVDGQADRGGDQRRQERCSTWRDERGAFAYASSG